MYLRAGALVIQETIAIEVILHCAGLDAAVAESPQCLMPAARSCCPRSSLPGEHPGDAGRPEVGTQEGEVAGRLCEAAEVPRKASFSAALSARSSAVMGSVVRTIATSESLLHEIMGRTHV